MRRLLVGLSRLSKPWTLFLAFVLAVLVGWLDYVTGYDLHVTGFYLTPICWVSWAAGRKAGLWLAVARSSHFWSRQRDLGVRPTSSHRFPCGMR